MAKKTKNKLTWLGAGKTKYPSNPEPKIIETFDNKNSKRGYTITFECPEYTSLCPITGQPDFAKITIAYVPDKKCIESKSLKLYIFAYRNVGIFFEAAVNKILEIRLLKVSKDEPMGALDISSSLDKIRKQTDKVKESLSSRRRDRVDPNKLKGFSIVDLAVAFDDNKKEELEEKVRKMNIENKSAKTKMENYTGNRYDLDDVDKEQKAVR